MGIIGIIGTMGMMGMMGLLCEARQNSLWPLHQGL